MNKIEARILAINAVAIAVVETRCVYDTLDDDDVIDEVRNNAHEVIMQRERDYCAYYDIRDELDALNRDELRLVAQSVSVSVTLTIDALRNYKLS